MTIAIVLTIVVALAFSLVVAVARDPGPSPTDVAIGYARAVASGDFDAVYRMTDPELIGGRNRVDWVTAERARPRAALALDAVRARRTETGRDAARVELVVDDAGRGATADLVCRGHVWAVERFVVGPPSADDVR